MTAFFKLAFKLSQAFVSFIYVFFLTFPLRYQWGMKISRWCSSSTSSRWWYQSASLSRDPCLSTTVLSHPHSRIAQGESFTCALIQMTRPDGWRRSKLKSACSNVESCTPLTTLWVMLFSSPWTLYLCPSRSPSVGYLQAPSSEQYQITQSPSPCNPQQLQQQYSGRTFPTVIVQFGRAWMQSFWYIFEHL